MHQKHLTHLGGLSQQPSNEICECKEGKGILGNGTLLNDKTDALTTLQLSSTICLRMVSSA